MDTLPRWTTCRDHNPSNKNTIYSKLLGSTHSDTDLRRGTSKERCRRSIRETWEILHRNFIRRPRTHSEVKMALLQRDLGVRRSKMCRGSKWCINLRKKVVDRSQGSRQMFLPTLVTTAKWRKNECILRATTSTKPEPLRSCLMILEQLRESFWMTAANGHLWSRRSQSRRSSIRPFTSTKWSRLPRKIVHTTVSPSRNERWKWKCKCRARDRKSSRICSRITVGWPRSESIQATAIMSHLAGRRRARAETATSASKVKAIRWRIRNQQQTLAQTRRRRTSSRCRRSRLKRR